MRKSFPHTLTVLAVVLTACQDGTLAPEAGSAGSGNDTVCDNTDTTPLTGEIFDNVVVPEGKACFIKAFTIHGNVDALKDSDLTMNGGTVENGNISASEARFVVILGVTLKNGNVDIVKTADVSGVQLSTLLNGNIKVEENRGGATVVTDNRVSQNIQLYKNEGTESFDVFGNDAGQSIQCFDNILPGAPGATDIRDNTADKLEGQCS